MKKAAVVSLFLFLLSASTAMVSVSAATPPQNQSACGYPKRRRHSVRVFRRGIRRLSVFAMAQPGRATGCGSACRISGAYGAC